jgi:transposase
MPLLPPDQADGAAPMTKVDDLSRSLSAFDQETTLVVVIEMSQSSWLAAGMLPGVDRQPLKKLEPNPAGLQRLLERWRVEAVKAGRKIERIALAYEAGRDGFWLARWLRARRVEAHVIHSTSVAVSRERRPEVTKRPSGTHKGTKLERIWLGFQENQMVTVFKSPTVGFLALTANT